MIDWKNTNSTGNEQIDKQHEEWKNIFNKLETKVLSTNQYSHEEKVDVLRSLLTLSTAHFKDEEAFFEQFDYPDKANHTRMHKEFHQELNQLYHSALSGEFVLNTTILQMMKKWFLSHTCTEDKKAFAFIQQSKQTHSR
jgi:hemerythrin-like metal-binding protein